MQTTSIQQTNAGINALQSERKTDKSGSSELPLSFDRILSRELGERSNLQTGNLGNFTGALGATGMKTPQATPHSAPKNPQQQADKAQAAKPAATQNNNANQAQNNVEDKAQAADAGEAAAVAKGETNPQNGTAKAGEEAGASTKADAASQDQAAQDAAALAGIPADMLALVASLNQSTVNTQVSQDAGAEQQVDLSLQGKRADPALEQTQRQLEGALQQDEAKADSGKLQQAQQFDDSLQQAKEAQDPARLLKPAALARSEGPQVREGMPKSEDGKAAFSLPLEMEKGEAAPQQSAATRPALSTNEGMPKMSDILAAASQHGQRAAADLQNSAQNLQINPQQGAAPVRMESQAPKVASAAAQELVSPKVGSEGWDEAVGQKLVWMSTGGKQSAELTLNPPDMGPLKVVLNINKDQASVEFTASQPEVTQALETAMPKLREMMSEAGVTLTSSSVSTSLPQQTQSGQQDQARQQGGSRNDGQSFKPGEDGVAHEVALPRANRSALGEVDTFA
ncbi:flagellar hook-length control protein FliK [Massilia sp. W12]|uniref:flagellar hook-length control protein FliK n=1 Tax=Massilia sp. W12 TaxID=3126507 RepID=UPI0030D52BBB